MKKTKVFYYCDNPACLVELSNKCRFYGMSAHIPGVTSKDDDELHYCSVSCLQSDLPQQIDDFLVERWVLKIKPRRDIT